MATPAPVPRPVNGAPKPATPTAKSRIGAIKRGQLRSALRYMFYGPEGVGKSSLLSDVDDLLLADIEGGSDNIDVPRYMFRDEEGGHVPRSYSEVLSMIEDLNTNTGHGFKALGFDTADALEALMHRYICEQHGKGSIEEFGFGKGYQVALDEMRRFLRCSIAAREGHRDRVVGHSIVKTFKNPEGEDYDRYQLRVHDKLGGLSRSGATSSASSASTAARPSSRAMSRRPSARAAGPPASAIVHLARDAAWDAKSRLSLPAEIELDVAHPWAPFAQLSRRT
jgi:hypothetical protein